MVDKLSIASDLIGFGTATGKFDLAEVGPDTDRIVEMCSDSYRATAADLVEIKAMLARYGVDYDIHERQLRWHSV